MLKWFYPYEYAHSVFTIDYDKLYNSGYRGLIFDIDNTLVPHGDDSDNSIDSLFHNLHRKGFQTLLLSNNGEERVKRFIRNIDTLYICNGNKPKPQGYLRAVEMLQLSKKEVVFIGDQIFTDIFGANRSRIASILVQFLHHPEETSFGKRRAVEGRILKCYKRSKKYQNRLGHVCIKEA